MTVKIIYQGKLPALGSFKNADKVTHAIYGGIIGGLASIAAYKVGLHPYSIGFASAAVFAMGKEIYDEKVRHKSWELLDILATISIPMLLMILFK
ncbi:MAG: hypothetical protein JKX78_10830 [Alteromonadaceae bacterium]|nr:hypothetical protein [Alteromonadaceae bacterium]